MKRLTLYFLLAVTLVLPLTALFADQPATAPVVTNTKKQSKCPVMDGDINRELFVDVEGKRIYLCCRGCGAAIRREPKKYLRKMAADGVTAEDAPKPEATATENK